MCCIGVQEKVQIFGQRQSLPVAKQVRGKYHVQSISIFYHESEGGVSLSPASYLLEQTELLVQKS